MTKTKHPKSPGTSLFAQTASFLVRNLTRRRQDRNRRGKRQLQYGNLEPKRLLRAYFPAWANGQFTLGDASADAPYGLNNTFKLESRPSASKTIYLDFNGHHSVNNDWNHSIQFPSLNLEGGHGSFTAYERIRVQRIFQDVAEDFLPFDVNVTTRNPGVQDLIKSNGSDNRFGVRVVITEPTNGFGTGIGGTGFDDSFGDNRDTPVFVFATIPRVIAIIASHETGHALGLEHDGHYNDAYHRGTGSGATGWGPLMGAPYSKRLTQWSNGNYAGSTNNQDDLSVITQPSNGFGFRPDDVGDSISASSNLKRNGNRFFDWGIIGSSDDVDYYRFQVNSTGSLSLKINPFKENANLDVLARIRDSSGQVIHSSNPANDIKAQFNVTLTAGTYYLTVDGVGKSGAYSDYGSLGFYSIEGSFEEQAQAAIGESGIVRELDHQWKTIQLSRSYEEPVVIVGPASVNGGAPAVVRVRNITSNSFQVRVDEWDYLDRIHIAEEVGFMVVEAGEHTLANGAKLVAKNATFNHQFRRIGFGTQFNAIPIVLAQVGTINGSSTVTPRITNVHRGNMELKLQEQESSDGFHVFETVGVVAIERGVANFDQMQLEAQFTGDRINNQAKQISFESAFASRPVFLATIQTFDGHNPAGLRHVGLTADKVGIFTQEEQSLDGELVHATENVGYLAMRAGTLFALAPQQNRSFAPDSVFEETSFAEEVETAMLEADIEPCLHQSVKGKSKLQASMEQDSTKSDVQDRLERIRKIRTKFFHKLARFGG